jgi:hypothetical protein
MPKDLTSDTFGSEKDFSSVEMQQGSVQPDADANRQVNKDVEWLSV